MSEGEDSNKKKSVYDRHRDVVNAKVTSSKEAATAAAADTQKLTKAFDNVVKPAFDEVYKGLRKNSSDVEYKERQEIKNADATATKFANSDRSLLSLALLVPYRSVGTPKGRRSQCRAEIGVIRTGATELTMYVTEYPVDEDRLRMKEAIKFDVEGLTSAFVRAEIEKLLETFFPDTQS